MVLRDSRTYKLRIAPAQLAQTIATRECAADAHDFGVTWEDFPKVVSEDRSLVMWRHELRGPAEKRCAGDVVIAMTPDWIEEVRAIVKAAPAKPPKQPKHAKPHRSTMPSAKAIPYRH